MPTSPSALREAGQFLRTCRAELQPQDVGLPAPGYDRRRVRGLRREEVAQLASISTDYYTRVEQGRLAASAPVLDTLIRALRLTPEQSNYLRTLLAQPSTARPGATNRDGRAASSHRTRVREQLVRLLGQLDDTPALVFNRRLDILAWNDLAAALLLDFSEIPAARRNYVRLVFTDPLMRELYPEWEQVARTCVAVLRMNAAENPADPALSTLVGDLAIAVPEFREWWAERRVALQNFGRKTIRHPLVGELTLAWDSFRQDGNPDQQLILWSAEPNSVSAQRLHQLKAHTTDQPRTPVRARQ